MLIELRNFAGLFFYEDLSSNPMVYLTILYINAGLYLVDFYSLMRRKSLLETFCVLALPCLAAVVGSALAAFYLHVPGPGNMRMLPFIFALRDKRLCLEILLLIIVYLLLWGFIYLSRRRRTAEQRRSWIVTCAPDYLFCIVILTVSTWRILGGEGFLTSQRGTCIYLYCISFLSCKIILLAIGIAVSLFSVKITIFRWKAGKNPSAFLFRYFLLYQNAVFRNVFLYSLGTMLCLIIPLTRTGEPDGGMIGILTFLLLCCIFIVTAAVGPVIKGIGRFSLWSRNARALKEAFCREYFQEEPIYRDHRYTITRNFLIDEQMPATFYYWPAFSHMTGWRFAKSGKTKILSFTGQINCTLTENDMQTADKITEYTQRVLAGRQFPPQTAPSSQNKLEQGYNTLFRWLIIIVAMAFLLAQSKA